jgi:Ca2+/Na+ antiporter
MHLVSTGVPDRLSPPLFFGMIFVAFGVTIVAVAVSAGRTHDRTIKRHVRLFGTFLVGFLVVLWTGQPGISPALNLASDFIVVAVAYSLFLMVMSLSPVGRVEKERQTGEARAAASTTQLGSAHVLVL